MQDLPGAKVYFDGSHYVAIPHTTSFSKKRKKHLQPMAIVLEDTPSPSKPSSEKSFEEEIKAFESSNQSLKQASCVPKKTLFDKFYDESRSMNSTQRYSYLFANLRQYFANPSDLEDFIHKNCYRHYRNRRARENRFFRKAYINNFNYFVTFTFDSKLHTPESFKKKLTKCLQNFHTNKNWKYIGVWELSPQGRLHFHCALSIPPDTMPGTLTKLKNYDINDKTMRITYQNSFFAQKFGRNDFEPMSTDLREKCKAFNYLKKYLEKTKEKLVYSRGLKMYFISDIDVRDIICDFGPHEKKCLLYDNFTCWSDGVFIGTVSPETIEHLCKSD